MPSTRSLTVAAKKLRNCVFSRSVSSSAGRRVKHGEHIMNRTPPPPRESGKWQGWEFPCSVWIFVTFFVLDDEPNRSIKTLARQKALKRLELEKLASDDG